MKVVKSGTTHRPSVDHQEGLGGAVEGAGRQGVRFARNDVAQVIVGAGGFAEGEFGGRLIAGILVLKQFRQGVE